MQLAALAAVLPYFAKDIRALLTGSVLAISETGLPVTTVSHVHGHLAGHHFHRDSRLVVLHVERLQYAFQVTASDCNCVHRDGGVAGDIRADL